MQIFITLLMFFLPVQDFSNSDEEKWEAAGSANMDVLIAEIASLSKEPTTNSKPPHVELKIIQLIHGNPKEDRTKAMWYATLPFKSALCGNDARITEWRLQRFKEFPEQGERYLLTGKAYSNSIFGVSNPRILYSDDDAKKAIGAYKRGLDKYLQRKAERENKERQQAEKTATFWESRAALVELKNLFPQAEFIAVGRIISLKWPIAEFEITELLRGPRLKPFRDNKYFAAVNCPSELAFINYPLKSDQEHFVDLSANFLLVLNTLSAGDNIGWPLYSLLPEEQGIFPLTDSNLAQAQQWCKEHPADPAVEQEIAERAKASPKIHNAETLIQFMETGLNKLDRPNSMDVEDRILEGMHGRYKALLATYDQKSRDLALQDKKLRGKVLDLLLRRAEIEALQIKEIKEKNTARSNEEEESNAVHRYVAFQFLKEAMALEFSSPRLKENKNFQPLTSDPRWDRLLRGK